MSDIRYRIKVYSDIRYNVGLRSLQSDIGSSDIKLSPISLITDIGVSAHLCLPVYPSLPALFTSNILSFICCPPNVVHCLQDNLEMLPSFAEIPPYAEFFPIVTNIFCGFGTYCFNFWIRILLFNWCGSRSRSYCIS